MDDARWTMDELTDQVASVLRGYAAAQNGQVRAVPDERSIRYYITLGLVDRPHAMRGRTALYGRRHLAQIVGIKRMQAAGRALADIARVMPMLDDATLMRVSGVEVPHRPPPPAARDSFWRKAPVLPSPGTPPRPRPAPRPESRFAPKLVLELARGVTIAIDPDREANDADADAIAIVAAPLVAELRRRRLIPAEAGGPATDPKEREEEPR
jgi:DNA-binding transcriptional MerR regulator